MTRKACKRNLAVVEIGSTGIRMLIAAIEANGSWSILDRAGKPVNLGRDVFTTGRISRDTSAQCLSILKGFRAVLEGWGLSVPEAVCMATSALREADNRDTFIDRVTLQTGFSIEIVEGIEEIRLMHLALQYALSGMRIELSRSNMMMLEVGGGSTEIMLLKRNRVALAHSLSVGTVRVQEQVRSGAGEEYLSRYLEEIVSTTSDRLSAEVKLDSVKHFVAIGSDMRIAAERAGHRVCDTYSAISRKAFGKFVDDIRSWSLDELVERLRIPYSDAEGIIPGIHIVRLFLKETGAEEVIVPDVSIREGMIISLASSPGGQDDEDLRSQVVASAVALGRKYRFDEAHGLLVSKLALRIFDAMAADHGLGRHERLLLEVAGILHDVGTFIKTSGHHKHSEYIVANSEIFGLMAEDQGILSNLVRYHRKQVPIASHPAYTALPPAARMQVVKLAAILRVADAIDRGHNQRMGSLKVERPEGTVLLRAGRIMDLSLERQSLEEKGAMFEDVYGLKVILA